MSALNGLPQGGGLSPILWSVVADSLLTWLSKQGVFAQGYADHGLVLVCGKFLNTICNVMQRVLRGVERWCRDKTSSVNPSKTEMILFTRRYKPEQHKAIYFFDEEVKTQPGCQVPRGNSRFQVELEGSLGF